MTRPAWARKADHAPLVVRGQRPPGLCDKRFASAYIFAAVRPATGEDFALVLPRVCTEAMDRFLLDFAATVPADTHAIMVLDGAGWHDQRSVTVPPNVTLVPLPPTARSSTRSSASGSTCASAISPTVSSLTTRPLSTPAASLERPHH
jgi:hypothetical protein